MQQHWRGKPLRLRISAIATAASSTASSNLQPPYYLDTKVSLGTEAAPWPTVDHSEHRSAKIAHWLQIASCRLCASRRIARTLLSESNGQSDLNFLTAAHVHSGQPQPTFIPDRIPFPGLLNQSATWSGSAQALPARVQLRLSRTSVPITLPGCMLLSRAKRQI